VPYNVGGMLTFLNATGLRMAKEMTFTGQPIDAARAERHGIINYVVPAADLEAFTAHLSAPDRGECPVEHCGHEGATAHSRRGAPDDATRV
jgi:enoyl-CoA hydratase/carnithine racemase